MKLFKIFGLNPHRHEGEDAAVGGTSTTPANGSLAAPDVQVVYGKPMDETTDMESPVTPAEAPVDRTTEYAKIKEQYKDLYEQDFKSNLDRRLKGKDKELGSLKSIVDPLLKYFEMPDMDALNRFIQNDIIPSIDGYEAPAAGSEDTGDGAAHAAEAMPSAADLAEQGIALADKLKAQGTEFDLQAEMQNPAVSGLLAKGLTLEQSYQLAHHDEIVLREATKAAEAQKRNTIEAIRTKGLNQVMEHASAPAPKVIHKTDPSNFNFKDLDAIAERVKRGEKIRF